MENKELIERAVAYKIKTNGSREAAIEFQHKKIGLYEDFGIETDFQKQVLKALEKGE